MLTAVLWPREREPVYNGKKLSEWLARYHETPMIISSTNSSNTPVYGLSPNHVDMQTVPGPSKEEAADAIRHIGTNALPCLVRWVGYERPAGKKWFSQASAKLSSFFRWKRRWPRHFPPENPETRARRAAQAFYVLGPDAMPAAKELIRIETNTNNPAASHNAWIAMALIGKTLPDKSRDGNSSTNDWTAPDVPNGVSR
jgi:hypothetical protein